MNESIRSKFPSLSRRHNGKELIYLDGPAGTQVPGSVIDCISDYYRTSNANTHGTFLSSRETDSVMEKARMDVASFLGAEGPHTISFGQNMTSLNFSLATAFGRYLQPGDEILITQLDHEANRGPWLGLRERGITVREIKLLPEGVLDYQDLEQKLNERTRLVAMGYASNIFGTVNDIPLVRKLTYQYGAMILVDAVHYAPHFPLDVRRMGCDFLLCSAYKFYGPHVGILYSKPDLLNHLNTNRLRTQDQQAPFRIETGTLNHAAIAGVSAAIEFIASLANGPDLRSRLVSAMVQISQHEATLAGRLYAGLSGMNKIELPGPSFEGAKRAPTISFAVDGKTPGIICRELDKQGIFGWDGHFYAIRAMEIMGMLERGGVTRLGVNLYNTHQEIEKTLEVLEQIVRSEKITVFQN